VDLVEDECSSDCIGQQTLVTTQSEETLQDLVRTHHANRLVMQSSKVSRKTSSFDRLVSWQLLVKESLIEC
jgi:hypothetical protein